MFCGCTTAFGADPNTQVCPVCLGLPGSLPVINQKAIEYTIRIGLALNCSIASWCRFARKNYFYPDMPKNFQISQYDEPLCTDGYLDVVVDGETVRVGIERVHLEEDTGKTLHIGGATGRIHGATESLVDYNRAGIPPVAIVTKPVPGTGAGAPVVAPAYVGESRVVIRPAGVSVARVDEWWLGELARRANEAGVDLAEIGATPAHVAELQGLVEAGKLNDKLARTVLEGVLAGEGSPSEVMAARGLGVVSDTGALTAAVDE